LKVDGLYNRVFIVADEGPVVFRELVNLVHGFYFGRDYPCFLRMPNAVFDAFQMIFRIAHHTRWIGRIQRISGDWFFDTRNTDSLIGFRPVNTKKAFLRYLHSLK
jgi:hypothetical protein